MSARVRAALAGAALGLLAPMAATGLASAGFIGQTGGAGFAIVTADQAKRTEASFLDLPSNQYASSNLGKVSMARSSQGAYIVMFRGVLGPSGTGGVAHARPTGLNTTAAACYAAKPGSYLGTDARIDVSCFDAAGNRADTGFVVMWGRGGTQEGALVSARFQPYTDPSTGQLVRDAGTSSLGSPPFGIREGIGKYKVWVQRETAIPFNREGLQISSAAFGSCAVTKTFSPDGIYLQVSVSCAGFNGYGLIDTPFDISYSSGASIIGMLNLASDAHVIVPKLTTNTAPIVPPVQRARIYGSTGGVISVARNGLGSYWVRLGQQAEGTGDGATVVTAYGSDARCWEAGSWIAHEPGSTFDRMVLVQCRNTAGGAVDTAFYLQHTTRQ